MNKLKQWPITLLAYIKVLFSKYMLGILVLSIFTTVYSAENEQSTPTQTTDSLSSGLSATDQEPLQQLTLYCWLGSTSCYIFEQILTSWADDNNINLVHKPLIKRPHWRRLAKAHLVAQQMSKEIEFNEIINQYLHVEQKAIVDDDELFTLLQNSTIDPNRFSNLFYAAETNQALSAIQTTAKNKGVRGIPTVIVNGETVIEAAKYPTSREMINAISLMLGVSVL